MNRYRERSLSDWLLIAMLPLGFIVVVGALALAWWPSVFVAGPLGVLVLAAIENARSGYRCANCGEEFEVGLWRDLWSAHGIGRNPDGSLRSWRLLTCPRCRQRTRATALRKE